MEPARGKNEIVDTETEAFANPSETRPGPRPYLSSRPDPCMRQRCGLGLDVSVSRPIKASVSESRPIKASISELRPIKDHRQRIPRFVIRRYLEKSIQKKLFCHLPFRIITNKDYFPRKKRL